MEITIGSSDNKTVGDIILKVFPDAVVKEFEPKRPEDPEKAKRWIKTPPSAYLRIDGVCVAWIDLSWWRSSFDGGQDNIIKIEVLENTTVGDIILQLFPDAVVKEFEAKYQEVLEKARRLGFTLPQDLKIKIGDNLVAWVDLFWWNSSFNGGEDEASN